MNKQWEYEEVRSFYRQSQIIGIPLSLDMRIFWASLGTYLKEENKNTIMNSLKFSPQGTSTQEESKNGSACQVRAIWSTLSQGFSLQNSYHTPLPTIVAQASRAQQMPL